MPAKWRTKSGCLTCRMRRKKCDEENGTCRACRRNGLTCIWPLKGVASVDSRAIANTSTNIDIASHCLTTFHNRAQESLFTYFSSSVLPQLLIPGTPRASCDGLLSMGIAYPALMNSLLACAALYQPGTAESKTRNALRYYSNALGMTRSMIENSTLEGTEDWLLVLTLIMCIFERAQPGPSCGADSHLLGASRIMTMKLEAAAQSDQDEPETMAMTCAASLIYHASTTTILSPTTTPAPDSVCWDQVQEYLESTQQTDLAMPPSLCRVILEITHLASRTPLNYDDRLLVCSLRLELSTWLIPQSGVDGENTAPGTDIQKAAELYALTADILLMKIAQPDIQAADSKIQQRARQILSNLKSDVYGVFWNQHYSWPFTMLACTVQRETEMVFLLGRLQRMWECSHWGDIKRTIHLLTTIYRRRKASGQFNGSNPQSSEKFVEPFDLLLQPEGISSLIAT
ncbi:hypothetical protein P170DRAFT_446499 [Aspergillus steynii IBT 23096]|uniref:Zn(2)-C6 fungal-type domain-containing protein n=1 Tax=Aspergillus steynii IBT 23096 TaxID=1392250 RepID=A0A2I2G6X5_9EURO|nr:uncharacterized protein P170DRAFT_446499 [Aspergillus steynii IBT 23096]PLB48626.1 hypothetical protein P170DRAFT_446499 [Aspergillus steynii IBT 23096]